jgi:hypothetical protein
MNFGFTCDPVENQAKLFPFELEMIQFARNSVTVEIDHMLPMVSIIDIEDAENELFLDFYEAQNFLEQAETYWNEKDISDMDAVYLAAYPYVEAL